MTLLSARFSLLSAVILSIIFTTVKGQDSKGNPADSVITRMILIGDAGEMDLQQGGVIGHAVEYVLKGKTTVFYLGDNIYPRGMGLPGSKEEQETKVSSLLNTNRLEKLVRQYILFLVITIGTRVDHLD